MDNLCENPYEKFLRINKIKNKVIINFFIKIMKKCKISKNKIDEIILILKEICVLDFLCTESSDKWTMNCMMSKIINIYFIVPTDIKENILKKIQLIMETESYISELGHCKIIPSVEEFKNIMKKRSLLFVFADIFFSMCELNYKERVDMICFLDHIVEYFYIVKDYVVFANDNGDNYDQYIPNYVICILNEEHNIDKDNLVLTDTMAQNKNKLIESIKDHKILEKVYDEICNYESMECINKFLRQNELRIVEIKPYLKI